MNPIVLTTFITALVLISIESRSATSVLNVKVSNNQASTFSRFYFIPTLGLRGGAKHKKVRARSWKEHGEHHRRMRKASIKKNRGVLRPKHYSKDAIKALEKHEDELRLKELEEKLVNKQKNADELKNGIAHRLRKYYMSICEQKDRERREKYRTLDDYSDPVERELEELRQKRGETRFLTTPNWRKEHPTFWKEVDKLTRDDDDLENPEKARECTYSFLAIRSVSARGSHRNCCFLAQIFASRVRKRTVLARIVSMVSMHRRCFATMW